jgi:hypothetical protein
MAAVFEELEDDPLPGDGVEEGFDFPSSGRLKAFLASSLLHIAVS